MDRGGVLILTRRALVVFDASLAPGLPGPLSGRGDPSRIALFPLTSDSGSVEAVERACRALPSGPAVERLGSERAVDASVRDLARRLPGWSARLGRTRLRGRSILEWLLTPEGDVSAWWFALLSEKNPLKTDAFLRIAQLAAVQDAIAAEGPDEVWVAINDRRLSAAVARSAGGRAVSIETSPPRPARWRTRLAVLLGRSGLAGGIVLSGIWIVRFLARVRRVRRSLGRLGPRPTSGRPLFVTYFPYVDREAARRGVFRDRYFAPLVERLRASGTDVDWLLFYVWIDGCPHEEAVRLGREFAAGGESLCFLEQFATAKALISALGAWIRQIGIHLRVFRKWSTGPGIARGLDVPHAELVLRDLWTDSLAGLTALLGHVYHRTFREAARRFREAPHCVYLAEMHHWEKALVAAFRAIAPRVRTVGFQHASVPRNYLVYFHDPSETQGEASATDLPLPDVIAANGPVPLEMLRRAGYPRLQMVEAIRHLHLALPPPPEGPRRDALLVAGSIDVEETSRLVQLAAAAFPEGAPCEIWIKAHPSAPAEPILERLGIDAASRGFRIRNEPIEVSMRESKAVLVGATSVALDGLAHGCRVLVPVFADRVNMSPLEGHEDLYVKIDAPEGLREAVLQALAGGTDPTPGREFVARYWCLDPALSRWQALLRSTPSGIASA